MSETAARDFVTRAEHDGAFATELDALKDDPQAVLARVRAEGFDVSPPEIRAAFLERYGAELSAEQLEAVAAGADFAVMAGSLGGAVLLSGVVCAAVAAA